MFRKLASLLFNEEEIIVEEDIQDHIGEVKISEVKPIVAAPEVQREPEQMTIEMVEKPKDVEVKTLKSSMISVDELNQNQTARKSSSKAETRSPQTPYTRKEIISPMYGGPSKPQQTPELSDPKTKKKASPRVGSDVISPMYGRVETPDKADHKEVDESLLDLDVMDLLSNRPSQEEVQVSLYDYLEGIDDDAKE